MPEVRSPAFGSGNVQSGDSVAKPFPAVHLGRVSPADTIACSSPTHCEPPEAVGTAHYCSVSNPAQTSSHSGAILSYRSP